MKLINSVMQGRTHAIEVKSNLSATCCIELIRDKMIPAVPNADLGNFICVLKCLTEDDSRCEDDKNDKGLHGEDFLLDEAMLYKDFQILNRVWRRIERSLIRIVKLSH